MVSSYNSSLNQLKDLSDLYELAIEENNTNIQNEVLENIDHLCDLEFYDIEDPLNSIKNKLEIILKIILFFMTHNHDSLFNHI